MDPCLAPAGPLLLFGYPGGPLPVPALGLARCCLDVPIALSYCLGFGGVLRPCDVRLGLPMSDVLAALVRPADSPGHPALGYTGAPLMSPPVPVLRCRPINPFVEPYE